VEDIISEEVNRILRAAAGAAIMARD